jgi:nitrogenase molybdenum-cofactor synthesis protein NifE
MLSGGRTQFIALKALTPWLDINQERHEAYAGYTGMIDLVAAIERAIVNPVWAAVRTPAPFDGEGRLVSAGERSVAVSVAVSVEATPAPIHHRKTFAGRDAFDDAEC